MVIENSKIMGTGMTTRTPFFTKIIPYAKEVIHESSDRGKEAWKELSLEHPADIAKFIAAIKNSLQVEALEKMPEEIGALVFSELSHPTQADLIVQLNDETSGSFLNNIAPDVATDLFEYLSDIDLKKYLKLLQKKQRSQITALLHFDPKSAGGIMNSSVLTLTSDLTVKQSISLLQRVRPEKSVRYRIYVTDREHVLVGYITLDSLVINDPKTPLKHLLKEAELVIDAALPQEEVADMMTHYKLYSAPVVDMQNRFVGVILADDLIEIIEDEAQEEAYKISGVGDVSESYFETSNWHLIFERSKWLISLLLLQSFSPYIMSKFDAMLSEHVIISLFLTMLIGTGGNAGNQSSTLVIRGLATGEIPPSKAFRLVLREFFIGLVIAGILSVVSFARVFITYNDITSAIAISVSLFTIVMASILLGTMIPLILNRFKIDPAHSAAPFLSTLMDIIGISIYCTICYYLL